MDFLQSIDDTELRAEIRRVLQALEMISEVDAAPMGYSSHSSERPLGPPGYTDRDTGKCPSDHLSLYDHYRWRFENLVQAGESRKRLWFLVWEADQARHKRVDPMSVDERARQTALHLGRPEDEGDLAKQIVAAHEGAHARKVSIQLGLPQGWVEKVREDAKREPEYGLPRADWRLFTDEEKARLIAEMVSDERLTQKQVAQRLGVSVRTVKRHWPKMAA